MNKETESRKEKLQPYVHVALVAVICMVVFLLVWTFAGPGQVRNLSGAGQASGDGALQTAEDGTVQMSGDSAGTLRGTDDTLPEGLRSLLPSPEPAPEHINEWVTEDSGRVVHYNARGELDTGWTAIDGVGCYFDDEGTYIPGKDKSKLIALTFDDGPGEYTDQLLDILEQNDIKATFMLMGIQIEKYPEVLPRMAEMGNTIGNHSYDHPEMLDLPVENVVWEFQAVDALLESVIGREADVVRFPYGDYTKELTAAVGKPQIYWDVDSLDWDSQDVSAIQTEIWTQIEGGCIILMHDIYPETVTALSELVPELIAYGYEPVTIEELAASRGYTLEDGETYFSFKDKNLEEGRVTDE